MGFSNIVSQVVLFMSILFAIVTLSMVYKTYVTTTNLSLRTQHDQMMQMIDTSFYISNFTYNSTTSNVVMNIKNTGAVKLNMDEMDIFIDNQRIERNSTDRTLDFLESKNLVNPEQWDPGEYVVANISRSLSSGNHVIRISVENGIARSVILEV